MGNSSVYSNEFAHKGDPEQDNNLSDKAESNLKSAGLLLETIQKEYANESERVKSLESRTGMFLAFSGALLAFLSSTLKLPDLHTIKVLNALESIPYLLLWEFAVLNLICLVMSVFYFVRVISVQTYKRLSLDGFNQENAAFDKEQIAMAMVVEYKHIISENKKINDKKVMRFKRGIYFILASLFFTTLSFIFSVFISA